jgi:hypothetical protein
MEQFGWIFWQQGWVYLVPGWEAVYKSFPLLDLQLCLFAFRRDAPIFFFKLSSSTLIRFYAFYNKIVLSIQYTACPPTSPTTPVLTFHKLSTSLSKYDERVHDRGCWPRAKKTSPSPLPRRENARGSRWGSIWSGARVGAARGAWRGGNGKEQQRTARYCRGSLGWALLSVGHVVRGGWQRRK